MPKTLLNQKFVESTTCPDDKRKIDIYDAHTKGLILEVRKNGKTYYLRYKTLRGKTAQKKLADASVLKLSDARKLALEKLALIAMGKDPFEEREALKKVPTFSQFVADNYMPYVKGYKRSWDTDESLLRNHILPALGKLHLDEIDRHSLLKLFREHRKTHKPGSTNRVIVICRYIFNLAIKWDTPGMKSNPTHGIDLYPENNKRERYLSKDEVNRLYVQLQKSQNTQLLYIVSVLLLTGARKREVLDAKWEDFDLEQRVWTIQFNKTGQPRYIPISDGLLNLLDRLPRFDGCPWLLPNPESMKPYASIFGSWNTARKRAGLPDVRIHDLRHSFASFLINSGRSLYEVQKILGHTQSKTTQRYAHLSQESLIAAANSATHSIPPLVEAMPNNHKDMPLLSVIV